LERDLREEDKDEAVIGSMEQVSLYLKILRGHENLQVLDGHAFPQLGYGNLGKLILLLDSRR
jgi:hypothetical protein